MGYKSCKACFQIRKVWLLTIVLANHISFQDQECPLMDSSYYWEVRVDGKWHILNSLRNTRCSRFLHCTFTAFCMLNCYSNQLCFVGNNFLHISLSISVIYTRIRQNTKNCTLFNKLQMQIPTSFRATPISLDVQRTMSGIKECGWGTGSCVHVPHTSIMLQMHEGSSSFAPGLLHPVGRDPHKLCSLTATLFYCYF